MEIRQTKDENVELDLPFNVEEISVKYLVGLVRRITRDQ